MVLPVFQPIPSPGIAHRRQALTVFATLILVSMSSACGDQSEPGPQTAAPSETAAVGSPEPPGESPAGPTPANSRPGTQGGSSPVDGKQGPKPGDAPKAQGLSQEFLRAARLVEVAPGAPPPGLPDGASSVRIVASGSMLSSLEPCGCAKNQIGGLSRRMFHLSSLPKMDLLLEGGNTIGDGHQLDFMKWFTAMQVLYTGAHPYQAQGVGPKDLLLPQPDFRGMTAAFVPLIASDLRFTGEPDPAQPWTAEPFRETTAANGTTIRVASLAGARPASVTDLELLGPKAAWERAMAGVAAETLRVLMVHGEEAMAYAATALEPRPDLVIGLADARTEAPSKAGTGVGGVPVVFPGNRGRWVLELRLTRIDGVPHLDYRPTPLEGSASSKDAMRDPTTDAFLMAHRADVASQGILEAMANQRPTHNGATYVGSATCATCHAAEHEIWQGTKHAHAWQTLETAAADPDRYGWPVTRYPECVSCHTVGYGEVSGFVSPETTPKFKDVGCESCHGPASQHVANPALHKPLRGDSLTCTQCHNYEQSPDFDYNVAWKKIAHGNAK